MKYRATLFVLIVAVFGYVTCGVIVKREGKKSPNPVDDAVQKTASNKSDLVDQSKLQTAVSDAPNVNHSGGTEMLANDSANHRRRGSLAAEYLMDDLDTFKLDMYSDSDEDESDEDGEDFDARFATEEEMKAMEDKGYTFTNDSSNEQDPTSEEDSDDDLMIAAIRSENINFDDIMNVSKLSKPMCLALALKYNAVLESRSANDPKPSVSLSDSEWSGLFKCCWAFNILRDTIIEQRGSYETSTVRNNGRDRDFQDVQTQQPIFKTRLSQMKTGKQLQQKADQIRQLALNYLKRNPISSQQEEQSPLPIALAIYEDGTVTTVYFRDNVDDDMTTTTVDPDLPGKVQNNDGESDVDQENEEDYKISQREIVDRLIEGDETSRSFVLILGIIVITLLILVLILPHNFDDVRGKTVFASVYNQHHHQLGYHIDTRAKCFSI